MNHLSEEINSDIINRTCTFRAYKSVTPSRIEIIEINRPRTAECYGNWNEVWVVMVENREQILLGTDFHCLSFKLKYISIYKSHRLCPTK